MTISDSYAHYWHPVPTPENRRHAFFGARRWDGRAIAETICGVAVPMAAPSEMDWVNIPTCDDCWVLLLREQPPEDETCAACPYRSSDRDRRLVRKLLEGGDPE